MELKKRITPTGNFDCNVFSDESFKRKDVHGLVTPDMMSIEGNLENPRKWFSVTE